MVRPASSSAPPTSPATRCRPNLRDELDEGLELSNEARVERFLTEQVTTTTSTSTTTTTDQHHDVDDGAAHRAGGTHQHPVIALARRRTELGLIVIASLDHHRRLRPGRRRQDGDAARPTSGRSSASCSACSLCAHLATRRLAPGADGMLLPLAALLNGVGYVFIARLDEAHHDEGSLAGLQAVWTGLGVAAFVGTLLVVRRARDLQQLQVHRHGGRRRAAAAAARSRSSARRSTAPASGWSSGPVGFQPGEFAKIALAIFFAGYLADNRELLGLSALHPKYLGPGPHRVGRVAHGDVLPEGPGLVAAVLRPLRGAAVGGDRAGALPRCSAAALFVAGATVAYQVFAHVQQRVVDLARTRGPTRRATASR